MNFKKLGWYLIWLLPWFLSGLLVRVDSTYYRNLCLPIFAPSPMVFGIVWFLLYFLIAYSVSQVICKINTNYKIYLLINYCSNQFFLVSFFLFKNLFLSLVDTIIVFISSMYLYVETKDIAPKYSWYLIPYIGWNLFAFFLMFFVFWMN